MRFKTLFLVLAYFTIMCFTGCDSSSPKCTLNVETTYGGCGIDGKNLESGSFSEAFEISEGDKFYENYSGHWCKDNCDTEIIILINKIDNNGVTIQIGEQTTTLSYNSKKYVDSLYTVYDGTNYEYYIYFTKE
ncbi:MAG: hypothetical protein J6B75_09180 [Ruminococcus sp.]|nr:hypothetical protein [Ruminococcus sp.]